MSDGKIHIEVDGKTVEVRKGQMLIEATDSIGAYIPRFCYHEKLSIAANCRMCLVEVEKAPKPLPACATPVADGMKVFTRSAYAIAAQKATMEFLLINHPLDCPICDQGGECELQDLAMGYGRDVSRYNDRKRVVKDKDLGPLVSTDMTRCIHCTRCVRFGEEITGMPELGTIGRAENMRISTFIEKSVDHELSANIIDLCPVGALNNKPYRYSARAWEMVQRPTVAPHDCVGSNMNAHVLRGRIKRIVPKRNEAINETWLSDRDRFSYEGIYSSDRLLKPRIKENGDWRDIEWENALQKLADTLSDAAPQNTNFLVSPSATIEENHLLVRIADQLNTSNIDHRLRRQDFSDQDIDPVFPWIGSDIAELENADAILIAGSNIRSEAPILGHRIRKAALGGARICFANSESYKYHFDVASYASGDGLVELLAGIAVAAVADAGSSALPAALTSLCNNVTPGAEQLEIAATLEAGSNSRVLIGTIANRHPASAAIRALAGAIADLTGASFGTLSEGANSAGAHLAGALPHRNRGGIARSSNGNSVSDVLSGKSDAVILFGLEPDADLANGDDAVEHLSKQKFVAAFTPYKTYTLETCADLLLPIGTFAETSGTFVNCEGRWQSFAGVANPVGEARPGWKVLRVLANLLEVPDSDFESSIEVRDDLKALIGDVSPDNSVRLGKAPANPGSEDAGSDLPIYQVDGVVRRAVALQLTPEARRSRGEII